ncbi:MAG: TRAP transporter substrate-binding protein DctP [Treponema sp.]|jgi:TRAP-type C4-dicarboxylate transport system substrate-binding protein|nr:TRAP transporter substrate-binding protein DctP [Treponema sp.]
MKKTGFAVLAVLVLILASPAGIFAQRGGRSQGETLEIKIASPLPRESPWGRTLDRLASEWAKITNNQVRLRVLHGGTEGGEGKMYLSLASNIIQAAVFTSVGLSSINPAIITLSTPFLIRSEQELDAVLDVVQGDLEKQLNGTGYFIVAWSKAGFVNVFSRDPVFIPDDLRKQKIASNFGLDELNTAFKTMGFQMIETDLTDVGPKLAAGTIMAAYQSPAGVAAYQLHGQLKNMLAINIAPIMGGIVINQITWKKVGDLNPRYQQEILRVTRRIAAELDASMQKTVADAVNTMTRDGLKVNRPSAAQEQIWYADVERVIPVLLGTTFDRDLYQKINDVLIKHRNGR